MDNKDIKAVETTEAVNNTYEKAVNEITGTENTTNDSAENELIIKLTKPYMFESKEYNEIDLTGVKRLTIGDAIKAQAELINNERQVAVSLMSETTTAFARKIAAIGSSYVIDFFKLMPRNIAKIVTNTIKGHIVSGEIENHIMKLKEPYYFEGKKYTEIDLNGVANMTSMNESEAENRLVQEGVMVIETSYNYLYSCVIASMATGLSEDFFRGLPISELLTLKQAVNDNSFFE